MPLSPASSSAKPIPAELSKLISDLRAVGLIKDQNATISKSNQSFSPQQNLPHDSFDSTQGAIVGYDPLCPADGLQEAEKKRALLNRSSHPQQKESQGGFPSFLFWDGKSEPVKKPKIAPSGPKNPDVVQWRFGPRPKHWTPEISEQNPKSSPKKRDFGAFIQDLESPEPTKNPYSNLDIEERRARIREKHGNQKLAKARSPRPSQNLAKVELPKTPAVKITRTVTTFEMPLSSVEKALTPNPIIEDSPRPTKVRKSKDSQLLLKPIVLPTRRKKSSSVIQTTPSKLPVKTEPVTEPVDLSAASSRSIKSSSPNLNVQNFAQALEPKVLRMLKQLQGDNLVQADDPLRLAATGFTRTTRNKKNALGSTPPAAIAEKPKKLPTRTQRATTPKTTSLSKSFSPIATSLETTPIKADSSAVPVAVTSSRRLESALPATVTAADGPVIHEDFKTPKMKRMLAQLTGNNLVGVENDPFKVATLTRASRRNVASTSGASAVVETSKKKPGTKAKTITSKAMLARKAKATVRNASSPRASASRANSRDGDTIEVQG